MWGSLLGMGAGLLGGMFSKKKKQDDPLAGVRAQLQALSSQVPGMVARQKELIGKNIASAKEEGMGNIQEQMHGEKGFGRTSIEGRMSSELLDKLARTQAEQELGADQWGLQQQMGILGSMPGEQAQPESNIWQSIGESIGSAFGQGDENKISDMFKGKGTTQADSGISLGTDVKENRPGTFTYQDPSGGYWMKDLVSNYGRG